LEEELGELARVSAGNPFVLGFGSETICPSREIGEAIPAFHLQVLSSGFGRIHRRRIIILRFGKERAISLARVEVGRFSLSWAYHGFKAFSPWLRAGPLSPRLPSFD